MMIRRLPLVALAAVLSLSVASCSSSAASTSNAPDAGVSEKAQQALDKIKGQVLSKGPNGESPSPASVSDLTPEEIEKIKALNAKAAIVMHYGGNDWATAQVNGLKSEFEKLGIKVIATTDANFKPDKQVSDIETVMTQDPDVIVSIPTDPVATASAYKKAAAAGTKLVFMDNVPQGLTPGTDYVSVVSADNYGNGVVSAHQMAKALGGKGKIGLVFHQADFFVTKQRHEGFKETIAKEYPDIQIVEEKGIAGPDFAGDAQAAANAMISKYPDLAGIWAVWDVPAEGVMAAARAAGRQDLKIATEDLGKNVAIALAKDELVVGLGAQVPFDQGVTEARLAAGALLGKQAPPYVALSALPVDHSNVLEAWKQVYHEDAPKDIQDSYKK
ncbi:ribose transport system substrate-binding protein [Paenarthrobacter nicotinovorans]|jgi:ribose transport system substrate-binding protein|uniref:Ribose transport system substrate-binding protein n=2 Tax=Paenarthrobacter nicotinovorans TaxID=29320 RepID=A0ABT9TKV6_PAENI|nr:MULTISPECIES: substrate-binding domain-containing protein [Paenarthrobacter]KQR04377.1 sugar ABC transporter substrate-binding protein [Arthrobacter sp. Leaf145]MBP2393814.1 ribose transport system substrate-binding protein [Paenarthrobacter nicotinovorans]MDQ0102288.1 ribose transport system substrate-binding protein [Paenarthrobacter nicotinovorans]QOT21489.1 substrate-binding domain-containing protein [Paenarthrobacter sp. YJN-D]UKE99947.1 substrate-binding domain-containing protein [Pae